MAHQATMRTRMQFSEPNSNVVCELSRLTENGNNINEMHVPECFADRGNLGR
jgi:hypothetical protein